MKRQPSHQNQVVFSGIQPSGNLHIGNYLGAIKQFVELQNTNEAIFCIVDHHAITVPQNPDELRKNILDVAKIYLACGIDQEKTTVFIQSHVSAHVELGWILNTMTPLGELYRMTQFKDKTENKKQKDSVLAGLLNYPTLMAADILLYNTTHVPVGDDQRQHVEFTRMIAQKFNNRFGDVFVLPQAQIQKETMRVMGLDDPAKKMSKSATSANNYIALLESPEEIRRKIKIAVTDSGKEIKYDKKSKPAISNLMDIYGAFSGMATAEIENKFKNYGYAEFKKDLGELLVEKLATIQKKYAELKDEKILKILKNGAKRADKIASKTIRIAKEKMGFII
ncbi:MAG: tryptophan--tRNA ligase [Patescibacteria group bacterium]